MEGNVKRIRRGEYTLAMISILGRDPVTGRTYEECRAEWRAELDRISAEWNKTRWWHLRRQIRLRWENFKLAERFGLNVNF